MWESKKNKPNPRHESSHPSNPASSPKETSLGDKIRGLFSRSRSSSPARDPASSPSTATDSHLTGTTSLFNDPKVIDSSTTGISADVESSVQQTPQPLIKIAESEPGLSSHSTSTQHVFSTILDDTSPPKDFGAKVIHSTAYQGIKSTVEITNNAAAAFSPLQAVTGGLLSIINVFETSVQNDEDQATMVNMLTAIVNLLKEKGNSPSPSVRNRVESLKETLDKQIGLTEEHMERAKFKRVMEGKRDASEIAAFQTALSHAFAVFLIDTTTEIESTVDEIRKDQLFDRLPRAMAAYDSRSKVPRNCCTSGTRVKILEKLVSWATDGSNEKIYWLNGMAGTGKTTIAYSFCEELKERELLGASFFCSRAEDKSNDTGLIFPTIAYELSQHLPVASSKKLLESLTVDRDLGSKTLKLQFEKFIEEPMKEISDFRSSFGKIVVLDALDECENQSEVATLLSLIFRNATNLPIKFFITSRPIQEIEEKFHHPSPIHSKLILHKVGKDMVKGDIRLYVEGRFKSIAEEKLRQDPDKWPSKKDITAIVERAGVLFIYAATVCSHVEGGYLEEGIKSRLQDVISSPYGDMSQLNDEVYKELDHLYQDILDAAFKGKGSRAKEDIKNVLHLATSSRHPLSAQTISKLLKVTMNQVTEALLPLHSVIAVTVEDLDSESIAPLHASFPDFLRDQGRADKHYLELGKTQKKMAKLCLTMIQDELTKDNICGLNVRDAINKSFDAGAHISDALKYACTYWASHVTELSTPDLLKDELMEFFNTRVLRWIECMALIGKLDVAVKSLHKLEDMAQSNTDLHYASMDGRRFLLQNIDVLRDYPLETYHSAMVWIPKKSRIRSVFPRVITWEVVCGLRDTWDACESVLKGHSQGVQSVAFSHDGKRVVSGSKDETIKIWNVETGQEERKFEGHSSWVTSVAFSHDRKRVVSGSHDRTIRIWNVETGQEERKFEGHLDVVNSVALSHDGRRVVSGSFDRTIRIWNVETDQEERKFEGHLDVVNSVALLHDGKKREVSGSQDTAIRIQNVEAGQEERKFEGHSKYVNSVAFSHDGKRVVSGTEDGVFIWNVETGEQERKFEDSGEAWSVAFSHDGKRVVSGYDDSLIRIWNVEAGQEERKFEGHSSWVTSVAFSHDQKRVVSGSNDRTIRVWNVETGKEERKFEGHSGQVESVALSHDGRRVVSGSSDEAIRIWNVETGQEEGKFEDHLNMVDSVAFSHDEKRVATGSNDGTIRIWNAETGKMEMKFDCRPEWVMSVEFSHDGKRVVSGTQDGVLIWNVETGEQERKFKGLSDLVGSVSFSHDGKRVVSGSRDGIIWIWNVETGKRERKFECHSEWVTSVAFSHDGKRVLSGSRDRLIRIWNVGTGEEERKFKAHSQWVKSVAFLNDGKKVVSRYNDGTIMIWNVETDKRMYIKHPIGPLFIHDHWITTSNPSVTHCLWLPTRYQDFYEKATADSAKICLTYATGQVVIIKLI